jgi:hypothetical protein
MPVGGGWREGGRREAGVGDLAAAAAISGSDRGGRRLARAAAGGPGKGGSRQTWQGRQQEPGRGGDLRRNVLVKKRINELKPFPISMMTTSKQELDLGTTDWFQQQISSTSKQQNSN